MVRALSASMKSLAVWLSFVALGCCGCNEASDLSTSPSRGSSGSDGSNRVKLEGVVSDRSGSCPAITFRLGGIAVQTSAATDFELACDRVVNGAAIEVHGPAMNGGTLPAREVEAEEDARGEPEFEAEGAIESLSSAGDCTSTAGRSVTVLGLRFSAGSFTRFREIAGCEGLAVGLQIRARGPLSNPPSAPIVPPRASEVERR